MFTLSRAASLVLFVSLCVSSAYGKEPRKAGGQGGRPAKEAQKLAGKLKEQFKGFGDAVVADVWTDVSIGLAKDAVKTYVDDKSKELKGALDEMTIGGGNFNKDEFMTSFKDELIGQVHEQLEDVMGAVEESIDHFKDGNFRNGILADTGVGNMEDLISKLKDETYEKVTEAIGDDDFAENIRNAAHATAEKGSREARDRADVFDLDGFVTDLRKELEQQVGHEWD